MIEGTTRQVLPTATGFAARQAITVLRKRNIEVAPLLRRVGLSERDLDNRQRRLSAVAQVRLLEYAAEALGDSAFGLHLAQQANLREAGLLFYVTSAARTIGETLPLYERYCRIVNEAVRVKPLRNHNRVVIEINFVGLSRHQFRQNAEFVLAANLKGMRENVGRNIRPNRSHIRTSTQFQSARVRAFLRLSCRVRFCVRPMVVFKRNIGRAAHHRRSISVGDAATLLRSGGKGAEHRRRNPAVFSREGIAETAAARQGQQTNRGEGAGDERADAVSQTGRRGSNLRGTCRSVAAKSRAPIHQGSEYIGVTNCVVAGLRRIDLVQSCFRTLDGPIADRGP